MSCNIISEMNELVNIKSKFFFRNSCNQTGFMYHPAKTNCNRKGARAHQTDWLSLHKCIAPTFKQYLKHNQIAQMQWTSCTGIAGRKNY